jgi:sugar lactone lactonase YvrE
VSPAVTLLVAALMRDKAVAGCARDSGRAGRSFLAADSLRKQVAKQMNNSNLNRLPEICAAAALLVGCGGSQPPIPTLVTTPVQAQMRYGWTASVIPEVKSGTRSPRYKATGPLLYATNLFNSENWDGITVYRAAAKDPAPLAMISDGLLNPIGACIDGQGTLYVTNEPASDGWVSEYPLGKTTPSTVITDGMNEPGYCAIDAKGNLWVANVGGPNVTEYLRGSKKPHAVITKGLVSPLGIAIDRSGNLYVGNGYAASQRNVEVYASGSKSPSRTITNGVTSPCALAVDSNGTLYVANVYQNNVAEYRSGSGDPYETVTEAMDHPGGVTVDKKGTLYVSNIGNSTVVEFAPGSLKPLKRQVSKGLYEPFGIAHYPALLP